MEVLWQGPQTSQIIKLPSLPGQEHRTSGDLIVEVVEPANLTVTEPKRCSRELDRHGCIGFRLVVAKLDIRLRTGLIE